MLTNKWEDIAQHQHLLELAAADCDKHFNPRTLYVNVLRRVTLWSDKCQGHTRSVSDAKTFHQPSSTWCDCRQYNWMAGVWSPTLFNTKRRPWLQKHSQTEKCSHIQASLFKRCELLQNLLLLIIKTCSVAPAVNLARCLKLCYSMLESLDSKEIRPGKSLSFLWLSGECHRPAISPQHFRPVSATPLVRAQQDSPDFIRPLLFTPSYLNTSL